MTFPIPPTWRRRMAYVLKSGAYWRGPIGRLDLVLHDPERRLVSFEGEGIVERGKNEISRTRTWMNLEPTGNLRMIVE